MVTLSKIILFLFVFFFIWCGIMMLLAPNKVRKTIAKAGSTPFINYAEITIRMIPAAALIIYSDFSKYPEVFKVVGWFMIGTSLILYFVPRKLHHRYATTAAKILKPIYLRFISIAAFSMAIFLYNALT